MVRVQKNHMVRYMILLSCVAPLLLLLGYCPDHLALLLSHKAEYSGLDFWLQSDITGCTLTQGQYFNHACRPTLPSKTALLLYSKRFQMARLKPPPTLTSRYPFTHCEALLYTPKSAVSRCGKLVIQQYRCANARWWWRVDIIITSSLYSGSWKDHAGYSIESAHITQAMEKTPSCCAWKKKEILGLECHITLDLGIGNIRVKRLKQ